MSERPKIKVPLRLTDKILNVLGFMIILVSWVYIVTNYNSLPETIPTHYDFSGNPDDFGHKSNIFLPLTVFTVLWIGIIILQKFPHLHNFPMTINHKNAPKAYQLGKSLLSILNFFIALLVGALVLENFYSIQGFMQYFMLVFLLGIFIPIIVYMVKFSKLT